MADHPATPPLAISGPEASRIGDTDRYSIGVQLSSVTTTIGSTVPISGHRLARPTFSILPQSYLNTEHIPPLDIGLPAVVDVESTTTEATISFEGDTSTVENIVSSIDGTIPDSGSPTSEGFPNSTPPPTASAKGKERANESELSAITQHGPSSFVLQNHMGGNLDILAAVASNLPRIESTTPSPTHRVASNWTAINESRATIPTTHQPRLGPSQWLKVLAWNPDNLESLPSPPDSFKRLNVEYDRCKDEIGDKTYWNEAKFHAILRTYYSYLWYHFQDGPAEQSICDILDSMTAVLIADMKCVAKGVPGSVEIFLQFHGDATVDAFEDRLCVTLEERFQTVEREVNAKFFKRESVDYTAEPVEPHRYQAAVDPPAAQGAHLISKLSRPESSADPLDQISQRPRKRLPNSPKLSGQPGKRSASDLPTLRPAKIQRTSPISPARTGSSPSSSPPTLPSSPPTDLPSPSPYSPASLPSGPSADEPTITSLDGHPVPVPASILAFNPSGPFPDTDPTVRDVASWMPYLTALGLTPGNYPAIQVNGKKPQTGGRSGRGKGKQPPAWNFLIYVLLAVVPGGRLKLKPLYNLCLAWCAELSLKNETCRHSLTTKDEFINERDTDEQEADENNKGWWRLANIGDPSKKDARAAAKKQGPAKRGPPKREPPNGWNGNGSPENGGPGPQTEANRKSKSRKRKERETEQDDQQENDAMEGVEVQEQQIQKVLEEEAKPSLVENRMPTMQPKINQPLGIGSLTNRPYTEPKLGHDALLAPRNSKRFGKLDKKTVEALALVPEGLKDEPPAKRLRRRPKRS